MNIILTTGEELNRLIHEAVTAAVQNLPSPQPTSQKRLLSRKEAAKKLRISLPTLTEYSKRGLVKSYMIGGRVLYKESDLEASLHEVKTANY